MTGLFPSSTSRRAGPFVDGVVEKIESNEEQASIVGLVNSLPLQSLEIVEDEGELVAALLTEELLLWDLRVVLEIIEVREPL